MQRARIKNAHVRIAQGNPTDWFSRLTMMRKIMPPMLEPATTIPRARARWRRNHVEAAVTPVKKRIDTPVALEMLCARMNW